MFDKKTRTKRRHDEEPPSSPRTHFERDSDRLLYCSAFRRLANVTQVVAAGEGAIFHNRLTHALKVAQIGRRLAQKLTATRTGKKVANSLGGLNPDVVEAAGLAHDLGHPPFGHLAEKALNDLVPGGYEGNAQAFRIVTKLAIRSEDEVGLNLTRATLNAILKYPWTREAEGPRSKKWGAYHSEKEDFDWAREGLKPSDRKTLEAEVMDFADDVAYSIFDLEDFFKAGKIPLERLSSTSGKISAAAVAFLTGAFDRWKREDQPLDDEKKYEKAFIRISRLLPNEPYSSAKVHRAELRDLTSALVSRYMNEIEMIPAPKSNQAFVKISDPYQREIRVLKELTFYYVINNSALATQQYGYRKVINELFGEFLAAGEANDLRIFPPGIQELLRGKPKKAAIARVVADFIAMMSEQQALEMYQRLKGITIGSFFHAIV